MGKTNLRTPVTKSDHVRGPESAPITLVEYGDYECPHCALAHPIVDRVQLYFSGRMRFVFRHFPMTEVHPHAEIAAESAEFAGAAGLFWDMHDALFENQSRFFLVDEQLALRLRLCLPGRGNSDAPRRRHQRTAAPRAASVRLAIKKVSMN